ncbi:MAG: hypothetical protein SCK28_04195 [Bacillota bacterium]|nr:hypothetical protein [Bacillota bacterium]
MEFIMLGFLIGIISFWDLEAKKRFIELIKDGKLELVLLIFGLDLAKGLGFYLYISANNTNGSVLVLSAGTMICGALTRYYYTRNRLHFITFIGFIWPIATHTINTMIIIAIVTLFITQNIRTTYKFIAVFFPILIYMAI